MLKSVAGTIFSKILVVLITFLVVTLNSNILGAGGLGEIAKINLSIMLIVTLSNFIGGGSLIYFIPRIKNATLLGPAYTWAILSALLFYPIYLNTDFLDNIYVPHVCALALLQSLFLFHIQILVGNKQVRFYNIFLVIQALGMLFGLLIWFYIFKQRAVFSFVWALYVSFGITFLGTFLLSRRYLAGKIFDRPAKTIKEILKLSGFSQTSTIVQLLNYRVAYFFVEKYLGTAALGIYSLGVQISEAVWTIPKGTATVQYTAIANDPNSARLLTLRYYKLVMAATAAGLIVLNLVPHALFLAVFGADVAGISQVILYLSPGILAMAATTIMAHYFSGIGKPLQNMIMSLIALVVLLAGLYFFLPKLPQPEIIAEQDVVLQPISLETLKGLLTASQVTSVAFCVQGLYAVFVFALRERVKFAEFFPTKADINFAKEKIGGLLNK